MSALRSAPSDQKASWAQKCSLDSMRLSGKRAKGGVLKVFAVDETSS